jgi:quaternary ammonium compound-resistance protein SugE
MHWFYLILAGLFEIGWIYSLKYTQGFTKLIPMIFYAIFGFVSAFFFSKALQHIPIAIAYAIWMGIAIIGVTITGIILFKEPYTIFKMIFISMILIGIIGLKLLSTAT